MRTWPIAWLLVSLAAIVALAVFGGSLLGVWNSHGQKPTPTPRARTVALIGGLCGLTNPAFCDTFDGPAGTGNRSGQLNGTVWGVSRTGQGVVQQNNAWAQAPATACGPAVFPESDIRVCGGQLVESVNDNGGETILAMYPKQPFDIAGRTGKVTFDVNSDSQGVHAAWPAFVYSDQPVPAPSGQEATVEEPYPRNGFGFSLAQTCGAGTNCGANCPGGDTFTTVDHFWSTRNYVLTMYSPTPLGCVQAGSPLSLNHFEVDLSATNAAVFATNPGSTVLVPIAAVSLSMPLTRGLIWIEDVHYNACKFNSQCQHTFVWDNVGFDGPVLARDLGFDVLDSLVPDGPGLEDLGYAPATGVSFVPALTAANLSAASAAVLTLNWFPLGTDSITYSLNGHASHTQAWPFPDQDSFVWRTIAIPVALSELRAGTNTASVSTSDSAIVSNIDLKLVGAGGVPACIDPSNCNPPPPSPTPSPSPSPTPSPTPQPARTPVDPTCSYSVTATPPPSTRGSFTCP